MVLPGSRPFSEFRVTALASSIGAERILANWIYCLHLHRPLPEEPRQVLEQLLDADEKYVQPLPTSDPARQRPGSDWRPYFVTPRPGTISPWSSKATNIAHVCGFKGYVKRIERAMHIMVLFPEQGGREDAAFVDLLHDRMTQVSVFSELPILLLTAAYIDRPYTALILTSR